MSLFDEFAKGVGSAVTDIRQKVVEEPYFGRAVTEGAEPQGTAPESPPGGREGSLFDQVLQEAVKQSAPDLGHDTPEPGGGMDL